MANKKIETSMVILDPSCGSKMFYFDKNDKRVLFGDIRDESHVLCDGRQLSIKPDLKIDFRNMPFADNTFKLVIFDPPHLLKIGENSWLAKKYGKLNNETWREDIKNGFSECFRVLDIFGVLIFKWSQKDISNDEILSLTPEKPIIGHKRKQDGVTNYIVFMKANFIPPIMIQGGNNGQ